MNDLWFLSRYENSEIARVPNLLCHTVPEAHGHITETVFLQMSCDSSSGLIWYGWGSGEWNVHSFLFILNVISPRRHAHCPWVFAETEVWQFDSWSSFTHHFLLFLILNVYLTISQQNRCRIISEAPLTNDGVFSVFPALTHTESPHQRINTPFSSTTCRNTSIPQRYRAC